MAGEKYTCACCAQPFAALVDFQKFCSKACGRLADRGRSRPGRDVEFTCEFCGEIASRTKRGNQVAKDALRFCSRACASARRAKVSRERLALERIGKKARARPKPKAPLRVPVKQQGPFFIRCACGAEVERRVRVGRAVCASCKRKTWKAWLLSDRARETRRASKKAYKVRRAGRTAVVESFSALSILERDNWTCQICGCATPRHLRGTSDDNAPEVDHIVALANGGAHAKWNVQCACRVCNCLKGASTPSGGRSIFLDASSS